MVKNRSKICIIISLAIFALAIILSLTGNGINEGIDFAGGMSMQYSMGKEVKAEEIRTVLNQMGLEGTVTVQGTNKDEVKIQIKDISKYTYELTETTDTTETNESALRVQMVQAGFEAAIKDTYPDAVAMGDVNYVGPVAGATLIKNALLSVAIAAVLMLIYIAFRFDLNSGIAAVAGLVHDVLMMLAFMVLLRSIIQMNSSFIAAMLTIVGYSINNTIVIFDRIRENARKMGSETRENVVNRSIKECLGRTLTTTATTLVTIVMLYIMGVSSIKEFALPIIIGIVSGVYSANMINGYVWAFLEEKRKARKAGAAAAKAA